MRGPAVGAAVLALLVLGSACAAIAPSAPPRGTERPAQPRRGGDPVPGADRRDEPPGPAPATPSPDAAPRDCGTAGRLVTHSTRLRDPAERSHVLERATAECPEDASAWTALAAAYRDAGDVARARNAVRRALALAPRDPDARDLAAELD